MSIKDQLHIMVVDDMSTSRGLIVQALESMGIRNIHHAADGTDALAKIARRPVHLVLSDFNMPGIDGLELLRNLRGNAPTRGVGFVLITGRADKSIIDRGKDLGMNNFIRKPFTPVELKACLEAVVGRF
ncbi:response regulator [Paracoccus luteus]|uniref:response regulator n=1 Tax=Paracoccus luteus TaxID=2508543 RepID=UPI001070422C|nr:response regulator [Paracoccus luteus]